MEANKTVNQASRLLLPCNVSKGTTVRVEPASDTELAKILGVFSMFSLALDE